MVDMFVDMIDVHLDALCYIYIVILIVKAYCYVFTFAFHDNVCKVDASLHADIIKTDGRV